MTIAYEPIFTKITGSLAAGILLSQLCYWSERMNHDEFYKTDKDLRDEICLGIDQFKLAKKKLVEMELISVKRKGIPAKTYYKISERALETYGSVQLVGNPLTSKCETHQQVSGKPTNSVVGNPPTTTETTHKITTKRNYVKKSYPQEGLETSVRLSEQTHPSESIKSNLEYMAETWNSAVDACGGVHVRKSILSDSTKQRARDTFKKLGGKPGWDELIGIYKQSPFLQGKNDREWKANFAWVLKPANLEKITSGAYLSKEKQRVEKNSYGLTEEENRKMLERVQKMKDEWRVAYGDC